MIELARARVSAEKPEEPCRVQAETRAFCRRAGFTEAGVFQAVIAVSERVSLPFPLAEAGPAGRAPGRAPRARTARRA